MNIKQGQTNITFEEFNSKYLSALMATEEQKTLTIQTKIDTSSGKVEKFVELIITDNSLSTNNTTSILIPLEMSNQFLKLFQDIQVQLNKIEIILPEVPPVEGE